MKTINLDTALLYLQQAVNGIKIDDSILVYPSINLDHEEEDYSFMTCEWTDLEFNRYELYFDADVNQEIPFEEATSTFILKGVDNQNYRIQILTIQQINL